VPNIHSVCVVRDEADILPFTLTAALEWADSIYVCDNGSTDGTAEIVREFAARHRQIVLAPPLHGPFRNAMRGEVANRFLDRVRIGDWWCRLDADEIYAQNPRRFLEQAQAPHDVVYAIYTNYLFTDVDLAEYQRDPSAYLTHWRPERLRYYLTNYSEPRFIRQVSSSAWPGEWPARIFDLHPFPERILMRHYDYRSPPQIEHRIALRTRNTEAARFLHEKMSLWTPAGRGLDAMIFPGPAGMEHDLWRSRVVRASALREDDGVGLPTVDWDLLPPLLIPPSRPRRAVRRARRWMKRLVSLLSSPG
jgi:glycosyltransferase involved in cell wall biosynthesis